MNNSVIKTKYKTDTEEGTLAVIGPKRMEYDRVVQLLEFIKKIDNLMLNTENIKSVTEENNDIIGY